MHVDSRRQPCSGRRAKWTSGFVLSNAENPEVGSVFRKFRLGRNDALPAVPRRGVR